MSETVSGDYKSRLGVSRRTLIVGWRRLSVLVALPLYVRVGSGSRLVGASRK